MGYHLFLDDIRAPSWVHWLRLPAIPDQDWVVVRNYQEFVDAIEERGMPAFVSFDHDLDQEGEAPDQRTGMDCARWLVELCMDTHQELPIFEVHSYNPVGRDNIRGLLDGYRQFRKRETRARLP